MVKYECMRKRLWTYFVLWMAISCHWAYGQPTGSLVTPGASEQAVKVYHFLQGIYGKKILTGAMARVSWNLTEARKIKKGIGRFPALACFDYLHLPDSQPGGWIDYSNTQLIERWWKKNGLVACMWHWKQTAADGKSKAFYAPDNKKLPSEYTFFNIEKALQAGTPERKTLDDDLKKLAFYLKLLKNKHIPVIWRPLHEASGKWFWWGTHGPEPYKRLWVYMFDFFQKEGLNNLIWVWTSENGDKDWYPGDAYVDIIGRDIYSKDKAVTLAEEFYRLQQDYPHKIIALTECGGVAGLPEQWRAGAKWSWFMPWYDFEHSSLKDDTSANTIWWKNAVSQDYVITREQMPNLK